VINCAPWFPPRPTSNIQGECLACQSDYEFNAHIVSLFRSVLSSSNLPGSLQESRPRWPRSFHDVWKTTPQRDRWSGPELINKWRWGIKIRPNVSASLQYCSSANWPNYEHNILDHYTMTLQVWVDDTGIKGLSMVVWERAGDLWNKRMCGLPWTAAESIGQDRYGLGCSPRLLPQDAKAEFCWFKEDWNLPRLEPMSLRSWGGKIQFMNRDAIVNHNATSLPLQYGANCLKATRLFQYEVNIDRQCNSSGYHIRQGVGNLSRTNRIAR